jgi:hypothetical protein
MKVCPKCNGEWPDNARFCPKCGSPLVDEAEADDEEEAKATVVMTMADLEKLKLQTAGGAKEEQPPKEEVQPKVAPKLELVESEVLQAQQERVQIEPEVARSGPAKASARSELEIVSAARPKKPSFFAKLFGFLGGLFGGKGSKKGIEEEEEPAFIRESEQPPVKEKEPEVVPEAKVADKKDEKPRPMRVSEPVVPEVEDSQKIGEFSETKWFMAGELIKEEEVTPEDLLVDDLQKVYKRTQELPEEVRKKYSLKAGQKVDKLPETPGGPEKKK